VVVIDHLAANNVLQHISRGKGQVSKCPIRLLYHVGNCVSRLLYDVGGVHYMPVTPHSPFLFLSLLLSSVVEFCLPLLLSISALLFI
jgi:hypothetical protein